jgi:hypothetical protein
MRPFAFYSSFEPAERRTFWLLLLSCVFDGLASGVMLLQETIAKKALAATDFQISLIGMIATATMVLAMVAGLFVAGRRKTWLLAGTLVVGRLVFLLAYLVGNTGSFLLLLLCYYAGYAVQGPVFSSFFQKHLGQYRGQVFGATRMALMLCSMGAALLAGKLLDLSAAWYKPLLCSVAVTGSAMFLLYIAIDRRTSPATATGGMRDTVVDYRAMFRNRQFMSFELMFFTYGLAVLMLAPAVPLFLINRLKFSYFEMAMANGVYAQAFVVLLLPLAGAFYDRINLWKLAAASAAVITGYPLLLIASHQGGGRSLAFAAFLFYSLGITGMMVLWNLGSLRFAGGADSFIYQGFHVSLTGVRGVAGPLLGYLLMAKAGFVANFAASAVLLLAAAALSVHFGLASVRAGGGR